MWNSPADAASFRAAVEDLCCDDPVPFHWNGLLEHVTRRWKSLVDDGDDVDDDGQDDDDGNGEYAVEELKEGVERFTPIAWAVGEYVAVMNDEESRADAAKCGWRMYQAHSSFWIGQVIAVGWWDVDGVDSAEPHADHKMDTRIHWASPNRLLKAAVNVKLPHGFDPDIQAIDGSYRLVYSDKGGVVSDWIPNTSIVMRVKISALRTIWVNDKLRLKSWLREHRKQNTDDSEVDDSDSDSDS
jgi:hypothetical protein